jgi:hypothetical protein
MSNLKKILLFVTVLVVLFSFRIAEAQEANPISESPPTPAQVIEAVNVLRLTYGLTPLNAHPVLMQIAQTEADGIATGMPGH